MLQQFCFLHDGSCEMGLGNQRHVICSEIGVSAGVSNANVAGFHVMVAGSLHLCY